MNPFHNHGAKFLPQEESTYQENIGVPAKSDSTNNPQSDDERHRYMNGQEPLGGEAPDMSSPIPEGDIQDKNNKRDDDKFCHSLNGFVRYLRLSKCTNKRIIP